MTFVNTVRPLYLTYDIVLLFVRNGPHYYYSPWPIQQSPCHLLAKKNPMKERYLQISLQLATPPGFQVTHIPKGNLVSLCTKLTFPETFRDFLLRSRVLSCGFGSGVRRGLTCTSRRKCGFRQGSVARALGVQSRKIWQVIAGGPSAELEPSKPMGNPSCRVSYFLFFIRLPLAAVSQVPQQPSLARQPRYNSRASNLSLC